METTLHRQLKEEFCDPDAEIEVKLGRYRIDVVSGERLIEIQRSGLSSIRDKIADLLESGHIVEVVKPLVSRKRLIKLDRKDGEVIEERWSPLRGTILDLFDELIYFTRVFPHPNLTLIAPMVQIEEIRYPGHGRRRRRRMKDFVVHDRRILKLEEACFFRNVHDLHQLLPKSEMPRDFITKDLAKAMKIPDHQARKIIYVLRKTGAVVEQGKRGNSIVCRFTNKRDAASALRKKKPKQRASLDFLQTHLERKQKKAAKQSRA